MTTSRGYGELWATDWVNLMSLDRFTGWAGQDEGC